jgi:hypothetical protein
MSEDGDRTKRLIAFKKKTEAKIEELENELKEQQGTLEIVNSILLEKGFKHPEIKPRLSTEPQPEEEKAQMLSEKTAEHVEPEPMGTQTLKSATGEVLAQLHIEGDLLHVVIAENKTFNINTPPFNQFLVQRVLLKMQERDSELVRAGRLDADRILCFDIIREGDIVRELVIRNIDSERVRELSSSIRWTLEKMDEKTRGQ